MIQCPKCTNQLPDWSQSCQFCGSDLKGVPRPATPKNTNTHYKPVGQPAWVWPAYYICAAYFILSGLYAVVEALLIMRKTTDNAAGSIAASMAWVGVIMGAVRTLIGAGLVARVDFIRGVVNIFCWLQILSSGLGVIGSLLAGLFVGPAALLYLLLNVFNICTAALMIFLIGETD